MKGAVHRPTGRCRRGPDGGRIGPLVGDLIDVGLCPGRCGVYCGGGGNGGNEKMVGMSK